MLVRTIIVDDELEAREGLRTLLSKFDRIEVLTCCKNGISAIQKIDELKPDLVFLDVQMPKVNGFEVLNSVSYEIPYVIFATAFDQYAVKAFEVNAQDYLLKPFDDQRFKNVLEKALDKLTDGGATQREMIEQVIKSYLSLQKLEDHGQFINYHEPESLWAKLTIKNAGRIYFIEYKDISWIEGFDYCIKIHDGERVHVVRATLKEMESKLSRYGFIRVSKSAIVNMNKVSHVEPYFKGDLMLKLEDTSQVKMSRSYRSSLDKYL